MDKAGAALKLTELFGEYNAVGVIHSVVVELSKYIIIILFAIYTWHCFTVFMGRNEERKDTIYRRQNKIMYVIHFICSLVLFLNSLDWKVLIIDRKSTRLNSSHM